MYILVCVPAVSVKGKADFDHPQVSFCCGRRNTNLILSPGPKENVFTIMTQTCSKSHVSKTTDVSLHSISVSTSSRKVASGELCVTLRLVGNLQKSGLRAQATTCYHRFPSSFPTKLENIPFPSKLSKWLLKHSGTKAKELALADVPLWSFSKSLSVFFFFFFFKKHFCALTVPPKMVGFSWESTTSVR